MTEIKENIDYNWEFIYNSSKIVLDKLKSEISESDILKDKQISTFKEKFPKAYKSCINGTFSLKSFKEQKSVYDLVYATKKGDHFDKKNSANIYVSNKIAKDLNVFKDISPPSSEDTKKAYENIIKKNELIKNSIQY